MAREGSGGGASVVVVVALYRASFLVDTVSHQMPRLHSPKTAFNASRLLMRLFDLTFNRPVEVFWRIGTVDLRNKMADEGPLVERGVVGA